MDMEESREEILLTGGPVKIKLPISNKKTGHYRPTLNTFDLIKSQDIGKAGDSTNKNLLKEHQALSEKKSKPMNKKQKVAILSWDYKYEQEGGITSSYILKLAEILAKNGQEIHIFIRGEKGQIPNQKVKDVYYHRIIIDSKIPLLKGASIFANKIYERIKKIEAKEKSFDVIHCFNWHPAEAIKSLQNGIPRRIVFTLHTNGKQNHLIPDDELAIHQDLLEKELIKKSDRIVCFDQGIRTEIQNRFSLPEEKVSLIQKEFDCENYQWVKDPGEVKKKYDLWPLDPMVLFVGGLNDAYGPDILVDAIPALLKNTPQLRFLLIGGGELEWPIRIKAHYLLFEHAIRLVGHKEGKDLQELVQAADIIVIPNRITTTPFQVLAAWSAKKPVVVTHAGGCGLIKHEENGILVYDNPNSIVWGVERILFDWDKGHEVAQKGWQYIQENFTWDAVGQKIENIYQAPNKRSIKKKK